MIVSYEVKKFDYDAKSKPKNLAKSNTDLILNDLP